MSSKQHDSRQSMNRNMCIKCWCGMINSSYLECLSSIHSPPSSVLNSKFFILLPQISLSNLNSPTSTLVPPSSIKSTGYLIQKVLKIAWFLTKCPKVPLAPFAAFSRSASRHNPDTLQNFLETFQAPFRHFPDIFQTPTRQLSDTFQTHGAFPSSRN